MTKLLFSEILVHVMNGGMPSYLDETIYVSVPVQRFLHDTLTMASYGEMSRVPLVLQGTVCVQCE